MTTYTIDRHTTNPMVIDGKVYSRVGEWRATEDSTVTVNDEWYTPEPSATIVAGPVKDRGDLLPFDMLNDFDMFDAVGTDGKWYSVKADW